MLTSIAMRMPRSLFLTSAMLKLDVQPLVCRIFKSQSALRQSFYGTQGIY